MDRQLSGHQGEGSQRFAVQARGVATDSVGVGLLHRWDQPHARDPGALATRGRARCSPFASSATPATKPDGCLACGYQPGESRKRSVTARLRPSQGRSGRRRRQAARRTWLRHAWG